MMRKICKQLHLWLSVPFGLIITLMCLSGAILIFERDFGHIGQAEVRADGRTPLPLDSILTSVEAHLAGSNQIVGVTTYPDADHAYKVMLARPAMAALWVDQYSGEVIGPYERAEIFKLASAAHRRLFGRSQTEGAATGKLIIGVTTIVLLLIIVTGLIIWWPKKGHVREKMRIVASRGAFRFWHDVHSVGGALCSLVLVICILTGLNWSFGWYRNAIYATLGSAPAKSSSHNTPAENLAAWEAAYSKIKPANTGREIRMYQGEADVVVGGAGNQQATDTYTINPDSGELQTLTSYDEKTKANHIKGWIYSLHVGSWLGWLTKILYLLCVITGALLPLTGYYLWIKRLTLTHHHRA